jgi:hypothetical protein
VLLAAAYRRTNLTTRQIGPLFGVSHPAAHGSSTPLLPSSEDGTRRAIDTACGHGLEHRDGLGTALVPPGTLFAQLTKGGGVTWR